MNTAWRVSVCSVNYNVHNDNIYKQTIYPLYLAAPHTHAQPKKKILKKI